MGRLLLRDAADVLKASAEYAARTDLPDPPHHRLRRHRRGRFLRGGAVARVARQAQRVGKTLEFANLPANLVSLATLYGVET
jgi:hypothetical protein